jgi:hypothetical protein
LAASAKVTIRKTSELRRVKSSGVTEGDYKILKRLSGNVACAFTNNELLTLAICVRNKRT